MCRAAFDTATLALRAIPLHITRDEKPEQMVSLIRSFIVVALCISSWNCLSRPCNFSS